ncbi:hypothetical protein KIW84_044712 [Lathyrus oleraceus]|uniref:TF-B3 domain-containing protein n=1 Tax=Pisum sativum TaxID=3888 RepID=A0A9D5AVQ3_PEA|nr:hypothetical protein KIW84_044712 [Pisum sativum]
MLTNGWSTFVNSKNLAPGDSCIFVSGENGEFGIGIRRDMKQHINVCCTSSSQQSSQNMQLPSLVAALHAVCIGTLFHVQYYPWSVIIDDFFIQNKNNSSFVGLLLLNL